jgi:hypothetical protein
MMKSLASLLVSVIRASTHCVIFNKLFNLSELQLSPLEK